MQGQSQIRTDDIRFFVSRIHVEISQSDSGLQRSHQSIQSQGRTTQAPSGTEKNIAPSHQALQAGVSQYFICLHPYTPQSSLEHFSLEGLSMDSFWKQEHFKNFRRRSEAFRCDAWIGLTLACGKCLDFSL